MADDMSFHLWYMAVFVLTVFFLLMLGFVHIDTSASPGTGIRVPVNLSFHVFQCEPFMLIQVLYEYGFPVNFTLASSFSAGCVFVQPYAVN